LGALRIHLVAGMTLALLVAACSSPRASSTGHVACVDASAPHHAYVVVQHLSGSSLQRCVGFKDAVIDGETLMDQAGVQYRSYTAGTNEVACQVDNEPAGRTQCVTPGQQYWALFIETNGAWARTTTSFMGASLHDNEALGWHYVTAADPAPAPPPLAQMLLGAGA
jgi:hypothetical protein